ncbi:hypothetical protein HYX06_01605 [Candidatus Woesearchaeota archaeon]|nr:hypothetical protein [Candidatus Woesearchaeota archaeon]
MKYANKLIAPLAASLLFLSQPSSGLESRVQVQHTPAQHGKFFRIEIHRKAIDLIEGKTPIQSGGYNEFIERVLIEYGLPFKREDIVASANFMVGYLSDKILIKCDVPGPDNSRIAAIWVSQDHIELGGTRRDGSPLVMPPYSPGHKP